MVCLMFYLSRKLISRTPMWGMGTSIICTGGQRTAHRAIPRKTQILEVHSIFSKEMLELLEGLGLICQIAVAQQRN